MLVVMCLYKSSVGVKAVGGRDDSELVATHGGGAQHRQAGSAGLQKELFGCCSIDLVCSFSLWLVSPVGLLSYTFKYNSKSSI